MNLLARILSHGFALVVVVLIAITLMYRGDLFPEWDLPEFLVVEDKSGTGTDAAPATVDRALPEAVTTSPEATTEVPLDAPEVEVPEVVAPEIEAPEVEVPEVVAPEIETPQVEVPEVEVTGEILTQDVVLPVDVVVPDTVDESPEISPAAAEEDELAVPKVMLAEPVVAAPSAAVTESAVVTEQIESPLADRALSMPVAEPIIDPQPESVAEEMSSTVTVTESEIVTEQIESPVADRAPSISAAEPLIDPQPASVDEEVSTAVTVTESEVVTEQLESPLADMAPSILAAEPLTDPQPESVDTAVTSLESKAGKSTYEFLAAAREAYWLHDYEAAENHYRRLIQLEPDNPDWYGELGNMYFAQGQWQQASAVYYEAGVRLLNDGKVVQARQMLDVIRGLTGVEADDLENQINASQVAP
ncbi:MAG TPA: hypothetical protein DCO71_04005 [Gammaproteobacteria bacterium]|nr:hypothetical protein [Gammaproteobacteria bacterium]